MALSNEDRQRLLALATSAVKAAVHGQPRPKVDDPSGVLAERRGCFVTLKNAGRLRGCIGTFQPERPLGEMVVEMAVAAATRDPRFMMNPIIAGELPQLTIEVSVLSPLEETKAPEKLEVGKHGIYIVCGMQAGCFLPEVATEMGWGVEAFLDQCCVGKAGLPRGAWRRDDTKVYLFTSEKFECHSGASE
ncbi:MAG: AmmeMemoRadiSam system protein A [Planctomycetota bacterium]|jgi:AmmeMemoRadiSam system protein A